VGSVKIKLKTILFGTLSIVFVTFGIFILNESLKNYMGYMFLFSGLLMAYFTQRSGGIKMKKKVEPLFKLEETKEIEKELSTDETIEKFGEDIKGMSEEFVKERESELKRLKSKYLEMDKLRIAIEKNVMNEHQQYKQLEQNMAIVESMAKSKGVLIEHRK